MGRVSVIDLGDLSPSGPTAMAADQWEQVNALAFLRVRLRVSDVLAVRPWYWRDAQWWPMRADGAPLSAGTAPLTADPAKFDGKAEGFFAALGLSNPVAMVAEIGSAESSEDCFIEPCEMLP